MCDFYRLLDQSPLHEITWIKHIFHSVIKYTMEEQVRIELINHILTRPNLDKLEAEWITLCLEASRQKLNKVSLILKVLHGVALLFF